MSVAAMDWAKRQQIAAPGLKGVLNVLAWKANKDAQCWPSQETIGRECGMSVRSVRRAMALLEQFELISRKPRSKGKLGRSSDLVTLSLDRDFTVPKASITTARLAPPTGQIDRLENRLQPAKNVVATGQIDRGYDREPTSKNLAKGKADGTGAVSLYGESGETDDGRTLRGGLRVVAGAAPVGRTAGEGSR